MNRENEYYICVSEDELHVIAASLIELAQETQWKLNNTKNKYIFLKAFEDQFVFSITDLKYVKQAFIELRDNIETLNIEKVKILFSKDMPKKSLIIYTALNECDKNFEDYEMSIRAGITKDELDVVLNDFKNLFPELKQQHGS